MADALVLMITGGSRGIGAATARLAARDGYPVALVYREREDLAAAVAAEIEADGGRATAIRADVSREDDVARLFDDTERRLGPVAALVNSAGVSGNQRAVERLSAEILSRLFAVNVIGTILCCRELVRRTPRREAAGAIVNVSSMAATIGGRAGSSDYAASKAAVDAFTVGLAKEVAAAGIRVNAVRPGMTRTDMTATAAQDPAAHAAVAASIAMHRMATAEEIARPILWLLSDAASFVSGALVDVSGGGFIVGTPLPDV